MNKLAVSRVVMTSWGLGLLIVALIIGIGASGYFLHTSLIAKVVAIDHKKIDSDINETALLNARRLSRILEQHHDSMDRASAIVADTKHYEYQNQIVSDITSYAAESRITILGFDFIDPAANAKKSSASSAGVKSVVASISLASPVPYNNYLHFLRLIERNLTKMQVTQLDLSNDPENAGSIGSPTVTIEVYVQ